MMKGLQALSLSYKNAPIDVREKVAIEGDDVSSFLLQLKEVCGVEEALLLSTCNRTEIFYSSNSTSAKNVLSLLAAFKGLSVAYISQYFTLTSIEATKERLFRIALGLESKVLGDIQIANQVKRAYQTSADLSLAGPYLHRLMHTIFYANKRVVQETRLQSGFASVASVAVDIIKHFVARIDNPRVVLIGVGEIGQNTLENLKKEDLNLTLVNRTRSKAEKFARDNDIHVKDFSDLENVINENDVIISAISVKNPIILANMLEANTTHKLFIDLSMPRSIDPLIDRISGVLLYNVDQLTEKTVKAKSIREKAIPEVEEIIADSLSGFDEWKNEMVVSPTIHRLKSALNQIRGEELARHSKVSESEKELLEVVTKNMVQKLIKLPVLQLKAACKRGEADTLVGVLNDLFDLEQQEINKE